MYRISSKGNPYHDAKGRFARKDSMDTIEAQDDMGVVIKKPNDTVPEDRKAVMWSSFGEQVSLKNKTEKQARKLDAKKTDSHMKDGKRFYHNQSIQREDRARSVSYFKPPKGTSLADAKPMYAKHRADFEKENFAAIKAGGKIKVHRAGTAVSYQIVESNRMANETSHKNSSVTRNTSTSMKQFHGYTVEFTKKNEVRSCKKDSTLREAQEHLNKYCMKHKKTMTQDSVCLKVWRDGEGRKGRIFYMPTYHFKTEAEANAFAAEHEGAVVVSHDDGYQG